MEKIRQIKIKNRTYYFYNGQTNLKDLDASLLKVSFKEIANCININSVNPLYLMIDKMIGHFEEKSENKYLVLDDVNERKEVSKKYEEVWDGIKK